MMKLLLVLFSLCSVSYASYSTAQIAVMREDGDFHVFDEVCPITGQTIRGFTWSRCRGENTMPIGCVTETGVKLKFGELYKTAHAEYRCDLEQEKAIFTPVACIVDGQSIGVDEVKRVGKFYFTCTANNDGIKLKIAGCSGASEELVSIDGVFRRGHFMFQCQTDGEKVYEYGVGCVKDDSELIAVDEAFRVDSYYYECKRKGQRGLKLEPVGCVDSEGDMVFIGDRFGLDSVLYECMEYETPKGKMSIKQAPVGCLTASENKAELIQYTFGERWYKAIKDKVGYIVECTLKGRTVTPAIVECVASTDYDRKTIPVGCGILFDKSHVFICRQQEDGAVMAKVRSIGKGKNYEDIIRNHGVAVC